MNTVKKIDIQKILVEKYTKNPWIENRDRIIEIVVVKHHETGKIQEESPVSSGGFNPNKWNNSIKCFLVSKHWVNHKRIFVLV